MDKVLSRHPNLRRLLLFVQANPLHGQSTGARPKRSGQKNLHI